MKRSPVQHYAGMPHAPSHLAIHLTLSCIACRFQVKPKVLCESDSETDGRPAIGRQAGRLKVDSTEEEPLYDGHFRRAQDVVE
jgi:hypothetical protein